MFAQRIAKEKSSQIRSQDTFGVKVKRLLPQAIFNGYITWRTNGIKAFMFILEKLASHF